MMRKLLILFTIVLFINACDSGGDKAGNSSAFEKNTPKGQASVVDDESAKNILQIAAGSADHSTLVVAVQAAEIEHVLVNPGPLTVFAPNNAAFEALPAGTVETLLKPENKQTLYSILINHAAPSTYKGRLLKDGRMIYMASGEYIEVKRDGEKVTIGGANILATIDASNGVIHVIDKVLVPPDK